MVIGTHTLMGKRLVKVFVINPEKDKFLCYKHKTATMFEVHHTVYCFSFAGHTNTNIVFMSVRPTTLKLITEQVTSLKYFTADCHSIKTFKITIFLTIPNLDLPLVMPFTGETNC